VRSSKNTPSSSSSSQTVVTWACWGLHITLKLVFWLGELPLHEIFTTENGTTVERLQNGKVRVLSPFAQGQMIVEVPPKPLELEHPSPSHTSLSRGSSAARAQRKKQRAVDDGLPSSSSQMSPDSVDSPRQHSSLWHRLGRNTPSPSVPEKGEESEERRPVSLPSPAGKNPARSVAAKGVASLAENEDVQEKSGALLARLAKDKGVQSMVGEAIAESSDSSFLAKIACNTKVQEQVASKVSAAATNKTVQKKVGKMVRDFANDEEAQAKAASVFGSLIHTAMNRG